MRLDPEVFGENARLREKIARLREELAQAKAVSAADQIHLTAKEQLEFVQRIGDNEQEQIQYVDKKGNTFLTFLVALLAAVTTVVLALFVLGGHLTISLWHVMLPILVILGPAATVLGGTLWSRLKGYDPLDPGESMALAAQPISVLIEKQDKTNSRLSKTRQKKHRAMQIAIGALFAGGAVVGATVLHWLP